MLVVETGAGVADADALIEVAYADAYHRARNNDQWSDYSTTEKEAAIRAATSSLWQYRWVGQRSFAHLPWPRTGVVDRDGWSYSDEEIPERIKMGVAELALRAATGVLLQDQQPLDNVKKRSETVGPISETYEYRDGPVPERQYAVVDVLFGEFLIDDAELKGFVSIPIRVVR